MKRNSTLAVPLAARHLRAAQTAADLDADALRAPAHRRLDSATHRASERHPAGQLLGDPLSDERRLELRLLQLDHVQLYVVLAGHLPKFVADPVDLDASAADHDARPGGVDVDLEAIPLAFDV